jgi:hypothetical protein
MKTNTNHFSATGKNQKFSGKKLVTWYLKERLHRYILAVADLKPSKKIANTTPCDLAPFAGVLIANRKNQYSYMKINEWCLSATGKNRKFHCKSSAILRFSQHIPLIGSASRPSF